MKLEILLSLALHAVLIFFTIVTSPFDIKRTQQYDDVIRVSLTALPEFAAEEPVAVPTPVIPQPAVEKMPEIPIEDPATLPETVVPEKPKPKPKDKPKTKPRTAGNGEKTMDQSQIETPATGTGSPFSGATIDNASFNYPYWFTQTFHKIQSNWRNPVAADGTIVCVIYFQVIKSGRVIEKRVEESSGIPAFDQACLQAVERSTPFPPLPRDFNDEIIGITLPFQYKP
jgi:TonB family protein